MSQIRLATILLAGSMRVRLLQQTLTSYAKEDREEENFSEPLDDVLVVVAGSPKIELIARKILQGAMRPKQLDRVLIVQAPEEIRTNVGALRNYGVDAVVDADPEYLHFIDDDVYLASGYHRRMIRTMEKFQAVAVLGGDQHPYHQARRTGLTELAVVDAVAGYSMMVRTEDWLGWLGPFDEHGKGVGASEDWALCQHAWKNGRWAAYIRPSALYHCGVTNSKGEPAVGSELIHRREGVVYE